MPQRHRQQADPVVAIGRAFAIAAAICCLAPLPLLLAVATSSDWRQGPWSGGPSARWMAESLGVVVPYAAASLRLALLTLSIDVALGLPAAWALARARSPWAAGLRAASALPIAVPGIALALGLTLAYPTWRAGGWLLVAGHVLYTLPFLIGALLPVLGLAELREREAVAATLGAGPLRRFTAVTLPSIRRALLAGAVLVVTLSLGEFNVSFFLFTPTAKTLPVDLYAVYITGRTELAAAATIWFLLIVLPAAVVIERLGGAQLGQV